MGTVEELKALRNELIDRRRDEAYMASTFNDERLAKLAAIHTAIVALDAVIAEGKDEVPSVYEDRGLGEI
jgi:hypothetical protein